jgi:serine/threonine-protein kinase
MLPDSRRRLAEMFERACELSPADRAVFLDRECAGEPELRRQIDNLLANDQAGDDLLERPAWEGIATEPSVSEDPLDDGGVRPPFCAPATRLESLPGTVLDQKYRIERELGKGAMGAVFQANHLGTTRTVALKVIVPRLAEHAEFLQRFKREAEAAGRLRHVNVVNVTDFGVARVKDAELAYLVMEYLDGQTLSSYLKAEPRPPIHFILDVIEQTALALEAAHGVGVVHRDLKPGNIWLEPNHRGGYNVKVLDFGIAKVGGPVAGPVEPVRGAAIASDRETVVISTFPGPVAPPQDLLATPSSLMTTVGTLLGTPAYMAPEQCQGLPVDGSADTYSLAVIAYEMLCGRLPFQSDDLSRLVHMHVHQAPQPPHKVDRSVPRALSDVVLNGLDKDPARRPPSAGAFAARLRAIAEGELTLLQRSKTLFHTHTNCFLPLLLLCLLPAVAGLVAMWFGARAAFEAKLAPAWVLTPGIALVVVALILFGFQMYKVACLLVLEKASESGQMRPAWRFVLSNLARGLPALLGAQLRSMLDLRPTSFRDNLLWPVIWARERSSGKQAIDRSRELCRALRPASTALMVRQYAPPLIGLLWFPSFLLLVAGRVSLIQDLCEEALSNSGPGWLALLGPFIFMMFYLHIGSAFSLLYWSALRCRGEGSEIPLPSSSRAGDRRKATSTLRPATLLWVAVPVAMVAAALVRSNLKHTDSDMEEALNDGRTAAVLGYLNAGVPVNYRVPGGETALFTAVKQGQREFVEALLARGADVNARSRGGFTPLWVATEYARNDIARLLLDRGAAVDAVTDGRRTALMSASMRGNQPLVELLLDHGANPKIEVGIHKTALSYALEEGHSDIATLLEKRTSRR